MPLNLKKDDMGDVIKDFYKSKAPQFKGKSKEKRREMAVAAKLTAERGPGAQQWYDGLIEHIASMGVEMIKYDDIVAHPDEVEAVAKAIARTGRPILLSLSPGGKVDPEAIDFFKMGNMLRVTPDVWDEQKYIDLCFDAWRKWEGKEQPGFWIDMDMIPLCLLNNYFLCRYKSLSYERTQNFFHNHHL